MDNSAFNFNPGSGRTSRRRAMTSLEVPSCTESASLQNFFAFPNEILSRQRSLSSGDPGIPTINISPADDHPQDVYRLPESTLTERGPSIYRNQASLIGGSRTVQPRSPGYSDDEPGFGLGLVGAFGSASSQSMPNASFQNSMSIIQWNRESQTHSDMLAPFADQHALHSPMVSPGASPGLSPSTIDSASASPFLSDRLLSSSSETHYAGWDIPGSPNNGSPSNNSSSAIGNASPKPLLTVNTQDIGISGSFGSSDGFSGSTSGWDIINRSPFGHTSFSQATSPVPSISSSLCSDNPFHSPNLDSEVMIDDSSFPGFAASREQLQQFEQDSGGEETTPTSDSTALPAFTSTPTPLHLQVPPALSHNKTRHIRRESDPFPESNSHVLDDNARISRSRSAKGRNRPTRGRSQSRSVRLRAQIPDALSNDAEFARMSRSPTPGASKGRRSGPMLPEARSAATDRRLMKDTCISCKLSRIKCEPCLDIWAACAKCSVGQSKSNGAQLCGKHSFSHKSQAITLDYTTVYWITHCRPSSPSLSRRLIPMPASLSLSLLQGNFQYLLQRSYSAIRVSSNKTPLFDISLQGSLTYLSTERNASLSSHRNWASLINTLSPAVDDGWLDCLAREHRLKTVEEVLTVLPTWTTQQGCFTYGLISSNHLTAPDVPQLDPDDPSQRQIIISAAQVSRIIARKVERIGFDHLQDILPKEPKSRPSTDRPPNPHYVRLLGLLALSLRFRYHLWSLRSEHPVMSIPPHTQAECVEAVRWICKSLYVNHCWLARFVIPSLPLGATPSTEYSYTSYAGAGKAVQELMSRGESESGFLEWWNEGATKVLEADMDPVVLGDEFGDVNTVRSGAMLYS